ncbi:MAG: hypothetical protein JO036_17265 [Candidatus Eremiobacteraeota bacterium]|nr:hypothetical protein [Candidatus Eremiobacteraeota bacterium]
MQIGNVGLRPRLDVTIDSCGALLLGVAADDAAQTARILSAGVLATRVREPAGLASEPSSSRGYRARCC